MFKRFVTIALIVLALFSLASCGQKYNIRDEAKTAAQQTVNVIDDYLARDISADKAYQEIGQVNTEWTNTTTDETILSGAIHIVRSTMLLQSLNNDQSRDEIKKARDKIAQYLK